MRAALALAEVDGHGDAAVTGGLDRFDLAQAHVHIQPALIAAADLGLGGAQGLGPLQQALGDVGQLLQALQAVVGRGDFRGDHVQCFILYR